MELIGFHGTKKEFADVILETNQFKYSNGYDEWLSRGIYFFKLKDDARWWNETRHYDLPCIVSVVLTCEEDKILNLLDDPEQIEMFGKYCNQVKCKSPRLPNGKIRDNYMQLAIERMRVALRKCGIEFDMAVAMFQENRQLKISRNYRDKFPIVVGQIQYCVYNPDIISKIKLEEMN